MRCLQTLLGWKPCGLLLSLRCHSLLPAGSQLYDVRQKEPAGAGWQQAFVSSVVQMNDDMSQEFLELVRTSSLDVVELGGKLSLAEVGQLAAALRENRSVTRIWLCHCGLGDAGAEALAEVLPCLPLEEINFYNNEISNAGARALATALAASSVRVLYLNCNEIEDEGAQALAACLRASKLTTFEFRENELGDEAFKAMAAGIQGAPLVQLDLPLNDEVSVEGLRALAAALKHSNLERLYLEGVPLTDEASEVLLEGVRDSALTALPGYRGPHVQEMEEALEANRARCFLLQMELQGPETFVFRTAAGTIAAVLTWSLERPVQELRAVLFAAIVASGFQLPDPHLRAQNLRIVRPDGQLLEDGPDASSLAQQLGL